MVFSKKSFNYTVIVKFYRHCQKVWIQIRSDNVRPDLGPNCLQRSPVRDISICKNNIALYFNYQQLITLLLDFEA